MQAKHHLACLNHLLPESSLLRQVIHARLQSNSYHQFLFEALEIVGYIIGRVFFAFPRKALNTHSLFLLRIIANNTIQRISNIHGYIRAYTKYLPPFRGGKYVKVAEDLKHLCFFSVKINNSTTGGFRVGFFQPDTNHP